MVFREWKYLTNLTEVNDFVAFISKWLLPGSCSRSNVCPLKHGKTRRECMSFYTG